jgi:hypothetical protein
MNQNKMRSGLFFRTGLPGLIRAQAIMNRTLSENGIIRWPVLIAAILLIAFSSGPAAMGAEPIDPEADKILRSMSTFLDGLSAFSVKADIDNEIIDLAGQKLQFSSFGEFLFQRPGNLHVKRRGAVVHMELIFDGKVLTLFGRNLNIYLQIERPGAIDTAIETLRNEIGLDAPGADLFYTDAYTGLSEGVVSSVYLGTAYVNGVECYHLTFREAQVDWQLWINAEGDPLPMKYIITTKWMTGAPQYAVRFRDWNTAPKIEPGQFDFKAPEGAKKIETMDVNEMGELAIEEEGS